RAKEFRHGGKPIRSSYPALDPDLIDIFVAPVGKQTNTISRGHNGAKMLLQRRHGHILKDILTNIVSGLYRQFQHGDHRVRPDAPPIPGTDRRPCAAKDAPSHPKPSPAPSQSRRWTDFRCVLPTHA